RRVRQPIGGDFGFSGQLARHYLDYDVWQSDVARYGIDIWMTTTALTGDYLVCQSYLGAKIHDAKDPGADLSTMLRQVTGSLFRQMEEHQSYWEGVTGSTPVPEFGFQYAVGLEPVPVNLQRMVDAFEQGVREFDGIYRQFLTDARRAALQGLVGQQPDRFAMPPDLWVHLVYDYAAAYHHRRLNPDHLLRSLTPLYLGRTAAWVVEAARLDAAAVERALDDLCERFESHKPYLLDRWHEGGKRA
ncbi:MAG TPA: cell wall biosynthesis glycosyltransferase, partial [Gemmatimonadales bacterium]|nr:cell wall biosynthesis glycosyltransferase [Gemmatimonadales bacterium]